MDYIKKFLNVEEVIGQGAFGSVLATSPIENHQVRTFALKCIPPILRPCRLANELRCMRDLGGQCNVVQLHSAYLEFGSLYIVMELIEHDKFHNIVSQLDHSEILMYMRNLLIALQHVHSKNIMHRDIKPGNFLFNRREKKFLLIDFGLATLVRPRIPQTSLQSPIPTKRLYPAHQVFKKFRTETKEPVKLTVGAYESPVSTRDDKKFSTPKTPVRRTRCECRGRRKSCATCQSRPDSNAPRSGTPGYKAPEVLLRYPHQTTAVDIWSAGVVFACLLFGHSPLFRDLDDNHSLEEVTTVMGTSRISKAADALNIKFIMHPTRDPVDMKIWCKTIRANCKNKRQIDIPDSAFDLLYKMLDPNPLTRITASEALRHEWLMNS